MVSGRDPTAIAWVLSQLQQLRVLLGPEKAKPFLHQEGPARTSDPLQPCSGQMCQQQEQESAGAHRVSWKITRVSLKHGFVPFNQIKGYGSNVDLGASGDCGHCAGLREAAAGG